jgi:HD-GYP domain-containing protein (c-di-GMP phosphodiesterase class II)
MIHTDEAPLLIPTGIPTWASDEAVRLLWNALLSRDPATARHCLRVSRAARRLGKKLGLSPAECKTLSQAGRIHDAGKIRTSDATLKKRGPLTPRERRHIEQHVAAGVRLLATTPLLWHLIPAVASHHQRYDGTGYPVEGLVAESIPYLGRILAVVDAHDAMSFPRRYRRRPMACDRVESILRDGAGTQWDPAVVAAFLDMLNADD